MNCTINPTSACETSFCGDGQKSCLGTISSPTSQVLDELENATANTFEDWMISSAHSWLGSSVQDSVFGNTSWDPFEKVAATKSQAASQPNEIAPPTEPPQLNFVPNLEETALDLSILPDGFMPNFPSVKFMPTTKHLHRHEKTEEGHIKLELPLGQPTPIDIIEKSRDAPREPRRGSRPRRMSTRALKAQNANKKEPRAAPKASEVSSKRRKYLHDNSKSHSAQHNKCRPTCSSSNSPAISAETRTNHNLIEKQYRNRLNIQFESLMGTLPKGILGEKKAGKAEVLVYANKYIQELEQELKDVEAKNSALQRSVKGLERRYLVMMQ
ncbi:uncharacterized protein BP5553_06898 [Venustampulla echinocandica]|uniref:BHLH domain-containing protein n=1 Tax=Venustampulla echinocandica TaxID=2656787 RepID=A0A370THZ4_9HELO|nr:uncharacterized protein BP5553_06898 [Venustampulla echinocandica]RDL34967.1 hypothetical protein BP5553_06898 [Venustampulla echinocandica]